MTLTERELQCLELACHGLEQKAIAHRLGISKRTVEIHHHTLREKLGARTMAQAAFIAAVRSLVTVPEPAHSMPGRVSVTTTGIDPIVVGSSKSEVAA